MANLPVDPCGQDRDAGSGSRQGTRFFFNANSRMCEQFVYFGNGGNRNNFASIDQCRATCNGGTPADCPPLQSCPTPARSARPRRRPPASCSSAASSPSARPTTTATWGPVPRRPCAARGAVSPPLSPSPSSHRPVRAAAAGGHPRRVRAHAALVLRPDVGPVPAVQLQRAAGQREQLPDPAGVRRRLLRFVSPLPVHFQSTPAPRATRCSCRAAWSSATRSTRPARARSRTGATSAPSSAPHSAAPLCVSQLHAESAVLASLMLH